MFKVGDTVKVNISDTNRNRVVRRGKVTQCLPSFVSDAITVKLENGNTVIVSKSEAEKI